jgi:alkanesulfonate monooxygenase SsuD/methylene tetrahydromethanopterin reductase-like flavin-dependent oxidoreductase (luciferase family)
MPRYLEAHGFTAFTFSGEWADLRHHVEQGRPLIVALKTGADSFHYAVVAGVGVATISLNDPADRKLRLYSRGDFEKRWLATGQWTLLAVPVSKS